ncbi:hypothetical protein Mapa_010226 [Marchantia paleacea]|nr:hypothetical protein Mapa_010226 [Marchantia paleacea]
MCDSESKSPLCCTHAFATSGARSHKPNLPPLTPKASKISKFTAQMLQSALISRHTRATVPQNSFSVH